MKQKIQDFVLLVKHDRKWQVIIAVFVVLVAFTFMLEDQPRRRAYRGGAGDAVSTGVTKADESNKELLAFYKSQNDELEKRIREQEEAITIQRDKSREYEERTAQIFQKIIERTRIMEDTIDAMGTKSNPAVINEQLSDSLEPFFDVEPEDLVAPPEEPDNRTAIIAAGDSVRIKLLAGVNAPTDGTPYPVVMQLDSDVYGPDGSALPLGEARLIAAAQGSLVDHRAIFRLQKLAIRYPDGSRKVVGVDGWVVGEDGIRGMEGILIDPIGKILAGEMVSGTIQGVGAGISSSNIQTTVGSDGSITQALDGDTLEYGIGRGLSSSANRWSQYVEQRADLLVPHVKILSGREATAVFSQNVTVPGLIEALDEADLVFASLD